MTKHMTALNTRK